MTTRIMVGDCREQMKLLADSSVDCIVTDPPYDLKARDSGSPTGKGVDTPFARARAGANRGGFMGMKWDGTGVAFDPATWREALRVLKPGGHLLAFGGTRTYHLMVCAIEEAGFEVRDRIRFECDAETKYGPFWDSLNDEQRGALLQLLNDQCDLGSELAWVYGSGFPKSLNVAKAIDSGGGRPEDIRKMQMGEEYAPSGRGRVNYDHGAGSAMDGEPADWEPQSDDAKRWRGWGTALKPSHEPIVVARKPLGGTVAFNVLTHGTGALNIDGCRVESEPMPPNTGAGGLPRRRPDEQRGTGIVTQPSGLGRWPANLIHDGSEEVLAGFPRSDNAGSGGKRIRPACATDLGVMNDDGWRPKAIEQTSYGDTGSAARFFYCAKADRKDRNHGCEHLEKRPLNWSSGDQSPGTFQAPGTDRAAQNDHPTVKPTDLMAYLIRLVGPRGGVVLDPFMGSGSSGRGAVVEGMKFIGIELDARYAEIARCRIRAQAGLFYVEDDSLCSREVDLPDVASG